jgi:hypothetical protein
LRAEISAKNILRLMSPHLRPLTSETARIEEG